MADIIDSAQELEDLQRDAALSMRRINRNAVIVLRTVLIAVKLSLICAGRRCRGVSAVLIASVSSN